MKEKLYYRKDIMKKYHISRRVIENYEHLGLVKATKKDKMGYLLYDEKAINQVGQIRFLQLLKIDLRQIKDILNDSKQEKAIINKQINILKKEPIYINKLIMAAKLYLKDKTLFLNSEEINKLYK